MEIKEMSTEELEARKLAIVAELDEPEADLDALGEEIRAIREELEARMAAEARKMEIRAAVAAGEGTVIEEAKEEKKEMTIEEIRGSQEYIDAFVNYIKTEDDTECRALVSEIGTGSVPVPTYVEDIVRTAWEKSDIMSRVRKVSVPGIMKVAFEAIGDNAQIHEEKDYATAIEEEDLVLGIVKLEPVSIKKWISVTDEVLDLRGTAFLDYVYGEIAYQIAMTAAFMLVMQIAQLPATYSPTAPVAPQVPVSALGIDTIAQAMANLSQQAANPIVVMNRLTWGALKAAQAAANYAYDPFEGLPVVFSSVLPDPQAAVDSTAPVIIVGDFEYGALANFPAGDEIKFKYDDKTLMTQDLVRILGREYVAVAPVAPYAFVNVMLVSE